MRHVFRKRAFDQKKLRGRPGVIYLCRRFHLAEEKRALALIPCWPGGRVTETESRQSGATDRSLGPTLNPGRCRTTGDRPHEPQKL